MAFLTIMGITVPVATRSDGTIEVVNAGGYGRAFNNAPYSDVRSRGTEYKGSTPPVARRTSTAYRLLLEGHGHGFAFDTVERASPDYYSTKMLQPTEILEPGEISTSATGGPVGNGGRLVMGNDDPVIGFAMPSSPLNEATLSLWVRIPANDWSHIIVESSGPFAVAFWIDGVSVDGSSIPYGIEAFVSHPSSGPYAGTLMLRIAAEGEPLEFAEVTVLPFRASLLRSDWASYMYNSGDGRAVDDLPYLSMGGTWVEPGDESRTDEVLGEATARRLMDTLESGSTVQYESFDFTLRSRNV
jgi:hypothetical protein